MFTGSLVSCPTSLGDAPVAMAAIRPEDIVLSSTRMEDGTIGKITQVRFEGSITRVTIEAASQTFTALSLRPDFRTAQTVWLHFPPERLHIFPHLR